MTVNDIDVDATIKKVQELLAEEKNVSPALRSTLGVLLLVVQLLTNRLGLTVVIVASHHQLTKIVRVTNKPRKVTAKREDSLAAPERLFDKWMILMRSKC